jgi:hypothetical protein
VELKDIIKKIKQIEIRSRRRLGVNLLGQYESKFKGQGMTFSEVRAYQFGDEIRRIDWNKTARFQEPFVKIMEEERELSVMLLVDISASMDYGTRTALKKDFVAEICASIGLSAVANNDRVGLILFADKIYKVVPPQKGRKHILSILSHILSADFVPTEIDFDGALEYLMNVFKKKSYVVIFSDFDCSYNEKNIKMTSKKYELLGIQITDEKDEEIPNIGYTLFVNAETGEEVWLNTSNARKRYEFKEYHRQKMRQLKQDFENVSANFLHLKIGDDYTREIQQIFRK